MSPENLQSCLIAAGLTGAAVAGLSRLLGRGRTDWLTGVGMGLAMGCAFLAFQHQAEIAANLP